MPIKRDQLIESKKRKGIKKCVVRKMICVEDYKACLFGGGSSYRSQLMFRFLRHEVKTLEVNKLALSRDDDKRITVTITPENFELVKENKYGCSIFTKIYCNKSGKTKCRISKGSYKNLIEIDELIDENFRGSCILKVYQAYIGSSKSISLSVQEILAREVERKESYFTDESDEESEEEEY